MGRDDSDVLGGAVLALVGAGVAVYASQHYELGALRRMGPGFFPFALGLVLAGLGLLIALPAWFRPAPDRQPKPALWPMLAVIGAILVFALVLPLAGLFAAVAVTVLIASLPAPAPGLVWRMVLAAVVAALTWAIFVLGLNMTIPLWPWSR